MNNNEKRWVVLLIAVLIIAVVLIVVLVNASKDEEKGEEVQGEQSQIEEKGENYTTELNDGTKINTGEEFNSTKMYGDLEISNIQYTEKDGMTVLLADVTNKGNTTHENEVVKINNTRRKWRRAKYHKTSNRKNSSRRNSKNKCKYNSRCKQMQKTLE